MRSEIEEGKLVVIAMNGEKGSRADDGGSEAREEKKRRREEKCFKISFHFRRWEGESKRERNAQNNPPPGVVGCPLAAPNENPPVVGVTVPLPAG